MHTDDDLVPILEDEYAGNTASSAPVWRILIVDDDEEVHASTRYALGGVQAAGRALEMAHAHSASEARALLRADRDFAVILLDVVMETDSAGLDMVEFIRNDMRMSEARIILRTGQPGYAPELDVFNDYDINDYRTKAELTRIRLITAITSALRSYQQIRTIAEHQRGLELIIGASSDLMERKADDSFAEAVLSQLATVLQRPVDGIVCTREEHAIHDDDPAALFIIGASGRYGGAASSNLAGICDPAAIALIRSCLRTRGHCFSDAHAAIHLKSGTHEGLVLLDTRGALPDAERRLLEVFATNIAASFGNVRLFERLNHIAYHDSLTALPNRASFICSLNDVVARHADVTVALVDLRHFSDLNNGLGHETGNALLSAVAYRMQRRLGAECVVARMSADVFGLIGPADLIRPERILELFAAPFEVADNWIPVGVTIGLYRSAGDEPKGLTLLRRANIALNHARHGSGERHSYFTREMEDSARARLQLVDNLRLAFRARELQVWFQPQIALSTGQVTGVEALLRWPDGNGGFISPPGEFIPLAEYSGLILELGEWVIDEACAAFMRMRQHAPQLEHIAVNVSMPQFRNPGFARTVAALMQRHGVGNGQLELEVTESLAMDEPRLVIGSMQALRRTGASIAIDDFGTGYSSLAHLRELPIDCLKIDRAFVAEIDSAQGGVFAETMITFARKLGIAVVAEGVETATQDDFLRDHGCEAGQGYLYARPMPLPELLTWLATRQP